MQQYKKLCYDRIDNNKGVIHIVDNELFTGISYNDVQRMLYCFKAKNEVCKNKQTICTYGESENFIGIILKGSAKLMRIDINGNRTKLENLDIGDVFGGEFAFSTINEDCIYVEATSDTEYLKIENRQITKRCKNACECHSILVENLLRLLTLKTANLYERLQILSQKTTREKLIFYMLLQSQKAHSKTFRLKETFISLADFLCVDRSAMTREIKKLESEGFMKIDNKKVILYSNKAI